MMKNYLKILLIAFLLLTQFNFSQNGLIGDGYGTNDWFNTDCFSDSAGDSRIFITNANGTGDSYFRLVTCWDNDWNQWGPSTNSNMSINYNNKYTSVVNNMGGAFYGNTDSSYNYIFKTDQGGTGPAGDFVVFEVQGTIRSVSSVSNNSVYSGHNQLISATLDGSLSTGQGVYLRYTDDSWVSSTIVEMSGNGTNYQANIPASVNTTGASISYYVFTSGNELSIDHEDADFFTINLNNNSGSNYSYSVSTTNYVFNIGTNDVGDVWDSHVDGSYIYLANFSSGISIVDISDKTNPTEVGSLLTTGAYDIFYLNDYLYVADYTSGMRIIDVSDRTNPTLVSTIYSGTSANLHYYTEINVVGNYAYIAAYKNFYIYDVSDVNSPTLVSTYSCGAGCNDFVIDDDYVYLANSSYGLQILDVSNPYSPTLTDSYDNGWLNGVSKNGNYIYGSHSSDFLDIYDVSDVNNILLTSSIDCNTYHDSYSMIGYGNSNDGSYVYMGTGYAGVQVFDISDPNNPSFHAFIRTVSSSVETEISGNFLYVSDRTAGLKIYDTNLIKTVSRWTNSGGDNLWSNTSNWAGNSIPTSTDDVTILNGSSITVDTGASIANLNIVPGGSLTINADSYLSINSTNNFSNAGTVTVNSNSENFGVLNLSTFAKASGKIIYKRWVNAVGTNEWDLIGSPVDGLSISLFASTNDDPLATEGGSGGDQYAIGYYDNSTDEWINFTTLTIEDADDFDIGKGYQMGSDNGATLAFNGTIATSNQSQAVQDYSTSDGTIWNLVANPYPTYLYANSNADSNNFITYNAITNDNLHDTYAYIFGWDADGLDTGYTIYNNTSDATYIAPGQGFMVASDDPNGTDVDFNEDMKTVSGTDDFIEGDIMENTEVVLKLFNGNNELDSTKLFFEEGLTLGLDPGYDAGHFDDNAPIMTRLIEEDEGYGMAINAMGLDAMDNAVIPLVINQAAGQEFRINLFTATIPDPNVYLEDVEEGTFTNLYEGDFVMTPESDLSGAGRFFIHMSADTMSNEDVSTSLLNAYKEIDASYITIEGLATQSNETKVSLYNILGREVLSTTLDNNMGTQTISTVGLSAGIYVIELESGTDRLTKKLVIK